MPRGVKGSGTPKKRGPKPRDALAAVAAVAVNAAVAVAPPPAPPEVVAAVAPQTDIAPDPQADSPRGPGFGDSLKRGQRLDLMDEAELRAYARTIGISPRDCDGLTVERLRQNCTAHLYELIDAL